MIDIAKMTDERGLRVAARGVKMIIPSELQFTAERLDEILKAELEQLTMISTQSYLWVWFRKEYRINNYLTDSDAFYIITDVPNGIKMFTRAPIINCNGR